MKRRRAARRHQGGSTGTQTKKRSPG